MADTCLFCSNGTSFITEEHIVPESMGNTHYILEPGVVCDQCNSRFSKFEQKVLTKTIYGFERARKAIKTKKGKPSQSKTNVGVRGDAKFRKGYIEIYDLKPEDFGEYDPKTDTFKMTVKNFAGSENATGKFLLKVGIESLYKSKRKILNSLDISEAKDHLLNKSNTDWPFVMTDQTLIKERSIPTFGDKHRLNKIDCRLQYGAYKNDLLFRFKYSKMACVINLTSRNTDWIKEILIEDKFKEVYPKHLKKKLT